MFLPSLEAAQIQAHLTKSHSLTSLLRRRSLTPIQALLIYRYTLLLSPPPPPCDLSTYATLLRASSLLQLPFGLQLHARLHKSGLLAHLVLQNSLLSFYSSSTVDICAARRVFAGIDCPDVASWTCFVSALVRGGHDEEALAAVNSMDVRPNAFTLVVVLPVCARLGGLRLGRAIHGFGLRSYGGHGCNVILDSAVLDMYMRCGDLTSARNLFDEILAKDVVSWTTLISGYAEIGIPEEAISTFRLMLRDKEVEPNGATMASVLRACASLGALTTGKTMHTYMLKSWIGVNGPPGNALVNMYAKCGEIVMAWRAFNAISCKDLVSWCTMLGGLAMSGQTQLALQLFAVMLVHGVRPDGFAFLALLSACCHGGLADQGLMIFVSMSHVYGIVPGKEHYTCVIDALGRSGRLKEAEALLSSLQIEADSHLLGVLLSARKMHGCEQADSHLLGVLLSARKMHGCEQGSSELFGEKVLERCSDAGGGTYALVSNILAGAGRYEVSNYVRGLMRVRRVKKTAGCSMIEVH